MLNAKYFKVNDGSEKEITPGSLNSNFEHMAFEVSCPICLNIAYPEPVKCKTCNKIDLQALSHRMEED